MKNILKITMIAAALMLAVACEKWTETESKYEPERIGIGYPGYTKDEAYYANLRAYKATMFDRKLSWAWYDGWTALGTYTLNSLAGLPDSLDIAAIWGGWGNMTPAKKADMEFVQKFKGTKVVVTKLIGNLDWRTYAPAELANAPDSTLLAYWGWEGPLDPRANPVSAIEGIALSGNSPRMYMDPVTEAQEAAIRKLAKAESDRILGFGYDGYDLDVEIGWGSQGTLAQYYHRFVIFVDELGKYMGPKSGTDKLLIFDGAVCNLPGVLEPYFDLFVIQAYNSANVAALNTGANRLSQAVARLRLFMDPVDIFSIVSRVVMTEDYEQGRGATGGRVGFVNADGTTTNSLMGMALYKPTVSGITYERHGGFGCYRISFEYSIEHPRGVPGNYPWMREAIQRVNPAGTVN